MDARKAVDLAARCNIDVRDLCDFGSDLAGFLLKTLDFQQAVSTPMTQGDINTRMLEIAHDLHTRIRRIELALAAGRV